MKANSIIKKSLLSSIFFVILVVIVSIYTAIKNKNISVGKTFGMLWHYLAASSIVWYVGLLILLLL